MSEYFNRRPGFLSSIPTVTKNIIIINFVIYLATELIGDRMYELFALFPWGASLHRPWQIVTHMFMHGGFWHIFFNMYTLFVFGSALERIWGSRKFLTFYFVTGLGAALCHNLVTLLMHTIANIPTVGASGAIYGLLMGYAMLFPNSELQLIFPPIRLTAKWFVIIFGAIELLTGLTGMGGNVAHFAHLGGMLFGWLLMVYWKKTNKLWS